MKQYAFLLLVSVFMLGCNDDEFPSSLADDMQAVITKEGVVSLSICYVRMGCSDPGYRDFSFPGDNTLRIGSTYYNLERLRHYNIYLYDEGKRMNLHFEE